MRFADIVARFSPPPPSVVAIAQASGQSTIKLAITRNWRNALEAINTKLDGAHEERTRLVESRRALLLAAVEGEEGANARLAKVERELADHDRHIAQLRDAGELARGRDDAEREAAAAAEYKRLKAEWEQRNADLRQLAEHADALASKTAAAFVELASKAEHQARSAPVELHGFPADRPLGHGRATTATRNVLARHGLEWAHSGLFRWPEPPLITEVIDTGITWAKAEVERAESRKNFT
jgi:hypothetical protein